MVLSQGWPGLIMAVVAGLIMACIYMVLVMVHLHGTGDGASTCDMWYTRNMAQPWRMAQAGFELSVCGVAQVLGIFTNIGIFVLTCDGLQAIARHPSTLPALTLLRATPAPPLP